jgi:hypothetical protein
MYLVKYFLILFFIATIGSNGYSQNLSILDDIESTDSTIYKITTTDGNEYLGTISSVTQEYVELETNNLGVIKIPISTIKSVQEVEIDSIIRVNFGLKTHNQPAISFRPMLTVHPVNPIIKMFGCFLTR